MKYFKGEDLEIKLDGSISQVFTKLRSDLTSWFNKAYETAGLGAIIYDNGLVPITVALARDIFIKNYGEILKNWQYAGTFESYLYVFMKIFGPQTSIEFERLAEGALKINITTSQTSLYKWLTKLAGDYITTHDGDYINLRALTGIGDFYEVQGVLESLVPAGIYVLVDFHLIGA